MNVNELISSLIIIISPNMSFRQSDFRSDEESTVYTSQSSGIRCTHCRSSRRSFYSLLRMTGFGDFKFIIYVTTTLRMTGLGGWYDLNPVIPTEKPLGFDEESRVCTSQSSIARSTYCRSSRHSLTLIPQDDEFWINYVLSIMSFRQSYYRERRGIYIQYFAV